MFTVRPAPPTRSPAPARCTSPTATCARRRSCRWRRRARSRRSSRARSPALGYEMVLGNTFHLFLAPGPELIARASAGCTGSCAGSGRSSPTRAASRSSRWATARSPTRSRAGAPAGGRERDRARSSRSRRTACAFAPTSTAASGSSARRPRWRSRRRCDSDIALVFDECTPFHVTREYTARSTERTHRWLERCLRWHERHGPGDQLVYGIVQGGVEQTCAASRPQTVAASGCDGIAIGGSLGRDKAQMYEVVVVGDGGARAPRARAPAAPARDRRRSTT